MKAMLGEYGTAPEYEGGETGDFREIPPTSGVVRHDSHMRTSGNNCRESNPVLLGPTSAKTTIVNKTSTAEKNKSNVVRADKRLENNDVEDSTDDESNEDCIDFRDVLTLLSYEFSATSGIQNRARGLEALNGMSHLILKGGEEESLPQTRSRGQRKISGPGLVPRPTILQQHSLSSRLPPHPSAHHIPPKPLPLSSSPTHTTIQPSLPSPSPSLTNPYCPQHLTYLPTPSSPSPPDNISPPYNHPPPITPLTLSQPSNLSTPITTLP
ncbi:hypothetical protein PR048_011785 [Dryococelus australis]|uniref:Uncharacterized protein n=1 Tax=Dryococelus australis TaxID=614101 RepID=A0ABQ9HMM7_9NEOP|nr:hypothetical protein PR048_011785 [Dryococelus australis]